MLDQEIVCSADIRVSVTCYRSIDIMKDGRFVTIQIVFFKPLPRATKECRQTHLQTKDCPSNTPDPNLNEKLGNVCILNQWSHMLKFKSFPRSLQLDHRTHLIYQSCVGICADLGAGITWFMKINQIGRLSRVLINAVAWNDGRRLRETRTRCLKHENWWGKKSAFWRMNRAAGASHDY